MSTPTTPDSPDKRPRYKTPRGIGSIVGVVLVLGIIGSCNSGDDASDVSSSDTSVEQTDVQETASEQAAEETTPASTDSSADDQAAPTTESQQIMPWTRHEMCQPDDGTGQMITGVLNDQSLTIDNAQLIKDGRDTWIGVSLIGPDGDVESRSDVWLLRDGGLYSVSGGAKNESWAVSAPGVSMADEYAAGVDRCVVAESMGR